MSLFLDNQSGNPLGVFDGYTGETLTFLGGEVCTWRAEPFPAAGAADVNNDGYLTEGGLGKVVPAISKNWTAIGTAVPPYFLADDGTLGYGTLFGVVVGGNVGSTSFGPNSTVPAGNILGPHTAAGSGKITCWDKPGMYGVSLDAVDTTNLSPTSAGLTVGMALSFTGAGLLTPKAFGFGAAPTVARLAEFETNGSLVTTPLNLVSALNSPSGPVSSLTQNKFSQVKIWFGGAGGMN
jgi:hypothetical protein